MSDYEPTQLRGIYRSHSHLPIWEILEKAGIWQQVGIEVTSFEYDDSSASTEAQLFGGSIDFVSGNHISPYALVARGKPIVCLASPNNAIRDKLVSREPIQSIAELRGKTIGDLSLGSIDVGINHIAGNHMLYLLHAGVALDDVKWIELAEKQSDGLREKQIEALQSGRIDAALMGGNDAEFQRLGLNVLQLDPLPMISGPTITSTIDTLNSKDRLGERLVKAMVMGIHFAKTNREETELILQGLRARVPEAANVGYNSVARIPNKPYPEPQSILNAYELCLMQAPDAKEVSPAALWDLHYLRALDYSGFIDGLYEQN